MNPLITSLSAGSLAKAFGLAPGTTPKRCKGGSAKADHILPGITPRLRSGFFLALFALSSLALCELAQAVSPPPDGGYPANNTAEGDFALFSLTTGGSNTANGYAALYNNTTGSGNTANGDSALGANTTGFGNTANGDSALGNNTTGGSNT